MNLGKLGPVNVCCGAYPGHRDDCTDRAPEAAPVFDTTGDGGTLRAVREFTTETGTYAIRYAPRDGVLIWTDRDYGPAACPVSEWLCAPCHTVHPWQEGDRLTRPCPRCGSAMIPTSPSIRALENMRTEIEALRRWRPMDSPRSQV